MLHTTGELASITVGKVGQIGEGEQPLQARAALLTQDMAQIGIEGEVFGDGEIFVETKLLWHIADQFM